MGIGGIGTSALAQWMRARGWRVSGTDRARSDITDALLEQGINVDVSEGAQLPAGATLLVYSDAVPPQHPLRAAARNLGVRETSYAELLGELTRPFRTIAVSGSHGKSTTTALVGLLLEAGGHDPTVVVGTRVRSWAGGHRLGNLRVGASDVAVVEADEYRGHFLTLQPSVAVVTSVDHDHVDAFPTPAEYQGAFAEFVRRVKPGGSVVFAASEPAASALRSAIPAESVVTTFAVGDSSRTADVHATDVTVLRQQQDFRLTVHKKDYGAFSLQVPGVHMVANAAAAVAAVLPFGVAPEVVRVTLSEFRGTWRRFELLGTVNGATLISDYAHHPTELRALLAAARQWYPGSRLLLAYQPHQRARTRAFASQFLEALKAFDAVILAEVYDVAGREEGDRHPIVSDWVRPLSVSVRPVIFAPTLDAVEKAIRSEARPNDVVLVVGAGDIDTVARRMARATKASAW